VCMLVYESELESADRQLFANYELINCVDAAAQEWCCDIWV
jgi:hypothetical protein